MTLPITDAIYRCCLKSQFHNNPLRISMFAFDALAMITTLVVGILGACAVIGMPAGAAYGLIGVGSGILLTYIATIVANMLKCYPKERSRYASF